VRRGQTRRDQRAENREQKREVRKKKGGEGEIK
jgi:hypothetical protein